MKLVWLMLVILGFKESQTKIRTYNTPGSGLSFLCGCASATQYNKSIPIKCKNGVIQMEPSGYLIRDSTKYRYCDDFDYDTCSKSYTLDVLNLEDRIEVYKQCSNQNSCHIKIAGVQRDKERLVNYPFYCHHESPIEDISKKIGKKLNNPIFYFTGEKYKEKKIDCDCSVTGSYSLELEIFFIHVKPSTTSKVKFLIKNVLFESSFNDITLLRTYVGHIGSDFKLEIRGLESDVEDVLYFRLYGVDLTVHCSGCRNSTDNRLTTPSKSPIDTPTKPPTTDQYTIDPTTSKPLATIDPDPSTKDPITTDIPSRTALASSYPDSSNEERTEDSTLDGPASAASTDQANSTTIMGGILAAVIIINIVGIALYCFIRRRKKQQKTSGTRTIVSRHNEQSQYNYIDITPDGPNYINSTDSNVVQNSDQRKSAEVYSLEIIPKNNQYHVLEVDTYSEPANRRGDDGSNEKRGRQARKDDYDHINDGSKFKPTNNDTYNHIDSTLNTTSLSDDYNHIGDQNGSSTDKLNPKEKNQGSGKEKKSYVNANVEPDEAPPNSEDVDTYNHLQH